MTRVINQELRVEQAQAEFFLHGAGRKNETFADYCKRNRVPVFGTPAPEAERADAERTITSVRTKLGRYYRPPIKA